MKRLLLLISLLAFCVLIINSCEKQCVTKDMGTIYLSAIDKQIVPYAGLEKLVFIDSKGDTMKFSGKGRITELEQTMGKGKQTAGAECPTEMYYLESNRIRFDDTIHKYNIFLYIVNYDPLWDRKKYLYISMENTNSSSKWWSYQSFNFDNLNLLNSTDSTNCKLSFSNNLTLGLKLYSSVYSFDKQITNSFPNSYPQLIYYTVKEGIIGFKTADKHTWYLH